MSFSLVSMTIEAKKEIRGKIKADGITDSTQSGFLIASRSKTWIVQLP